jgi:hypothetical protein
MEYRHSPQDNALRRELRTLSKKILLDEAQSRLDSARKVPHTNKEVLDHVFKQNSFRNSFPSTTFALPAEATNVPQVSKPFYNRRFLGDQ